MAWNDIPERLQPLELEAHIRRRQESPSNVEIVAVFILMSAAMDNDLVMPEVPAVRRWRIWLRHLKKNRGILEWFQKLLLLWFLLFFSFFYLCHHLLTYCSFFFFSFVVSWLAIEFRWLWIIHGCKFWWCFIRVPEGRKMLVVEEGIL